MSSPHSLESLCGTTNSLAPYYSRFGVGQRLLLTGHSHQAWPDCAREAQLEAFDAAAAGLDHKWEQAFERADTVRAAFRRWLGDPEGTLALGANTHELVVRWLSALPLIRRPRVVTTDSEFHSARRQLGRLAEEGLEVVCVAATPVATLAERLREAVQRDLERTSAVLVSSVLFNTGEIVPHLEELGPWLSERGVSLLVDAYHHLGVVPFSMRGLEQAYIVGGGYKYLQLGEGNCFLRLPADTTLRPVITGWFAEFPWIDADDHPARTRYAAGAARFSGATYDPTSHYRAARVDAFFQAQELSIPLLRAVSQRQTARLLEGVRALDADPAHLRPAMTGPHTGLAGFVALICGDATALEQGLVTRGVRVDRRGATLRLGPAPYLTDSQLDTALAALGETLHRPAAVL